MLIRFHRNQIPAPCISIASISPELLEWVKSKTGLGTIKSKKNYKPGIHANSYTYFTKYNDAIKILEMTEPYLINRLKKLRAQLILEHYKSLTPRNGRYALITSVVVLNTQTFICLTTVVIFQIVLEKLSVLILPTKDSALAR